MFKYKEFTKMEIAARKSKKREYQLNNNFRYFYQHHNSRARMCEKAYKMLTKS